MIKKCILAVSCCLPLGLLAQKDFTLSGKVGTLASPAKAYLSYTDNGNKVRDSAILKNGQFSFKGKLKSPVYAELTVKHDTATQTKFAATDNLGFYLENSNITVTSPDSVWRALVKGSSTNDDQRELRVLIQPYRRSADSLVKVYNTLTPEQRKDSAWMKAAGVVMGITQRGYDSVNRVFMAKHPNSHISLNVFKEIELAHNFNPDTAAAKFSRFPSSLKESALGKQIAATIETGRKTNTGVLAMDFTEYDTTGKAVKLSNFRGQYVLVDFWASWCKPCRAENPNMLAAYNKYKEKNFTILGVSLDENDGRRAWLGAVKKDGLPWTQVSELKGFQGKSAVLYGVTAIPSNFLVDPNGKIIGRNLRGEDLQKKLAGLFSK